MARLAPLDRSHLALEVKWFLAAAIAQSLR